jgi:hypothetical protein
MDRHQPCPNCASEKAESIAFTWWGGVVGPKMFNHVKCTQCGTTYNGKTGRSNQTAIAIYLAISTTIAIVVVTVLSPSRQQRSSDTSAVYNQYFDRVEIATLAKVNNRY